MRILVAEDEKALNRILVKQFTKEGYSVDSCFDGESVLDFIAGAKYDAIVMDVMMPVKDGFQVLTEMRNMKKAWLLKGMNIKIEGDVKTLTPIDVCTAVKPLKGATSQRGCILMQDDEVKVKSIADWFLFDTEKKRPARIPGDMAESYQMHEFDDDFFTYRKPDIIDDASYLYTVRVSNRDIDTNCHLNNEKGAELLMDALPFEFKFNFVKTLFKKPCFLGDELEVCMKKIESGYYVHLQTQEKEVCVIGTFEML